MTFKPTAGEVANLWEFIITNQSHLCLMEHWIYHAEDPGVKRILELSRETAVRIVEGGLSLYVKAGFPPPIGFNQESDVKPEVPKIMSDKLVLTVLHILSEYGVYGYGLTVGKTVTPEVLSYFKACLNDSVHLYQEITQEIERKGQGGQLVYPPLPLKAEMIEHHSFLAGWWGEQRSLTLAEVDNLLFSLRGVMLAKMMFLAFENIASDQELKKLLNRAVQLTSKRLEKFQTFNASEGIPFQPTFESEITGSTVSPYSDRLILFKTLVLIQISMARYGNALCTSTRRDLAVMFAKFIAESGTFADDALKMMIERSWLEQPPMLRYTETQRDH